MRFLVVRAVVEAEFLDGKRHKVNLGLLLCTGGLAEDVVAPVADAVGRLLERLAILVGRLAGAEFDGLQY